MSYKYDVIDLQRERKKDGVEGCFFLLGIFIDCAYNGEYKQRTKMYKKCGYYKQPHTYIHYMCCILFSFFCASDEYINPSAGCRPLLTIRSNCFDFV